MELSDLITSRSYVKGIITRIAEFCESEKFIIASEELVKEKKRRLIKAFEDYEGFNKTILSLDLTDLEDYGAVENLCDSCFAKFNSRSKMAAEKTLSVCVEKKIIKTKDKDAEVEFETRFDKGQRVEDKNNATDKQIEGLRNNINFKQDTVVKNDAERKVQEPRAYVQCRKEVSTGKGKVETLIELRNSKSFKKQTEAKAGDLETIEKEKKVDDHISTEKLGNQRTDKVGTEKVLESDSRESIEKEMVTVSETKDNRLVIDHKQGNIKIVHVDGGNQIKFHKMKTVMMEKLERSDNLIKDTKADKKAGEEDLNEETNRQWEEEQRYNEDLNREEEAIPLEVEEEYRKEETDRLWEEKERYNEELRREEEAELEAKKEYKREEADKQWEEMQRYNEELRREEEAEIEADEERRREEADRLWEENERYNEELLREEEAKLEAEDEYRREEADRLWEENERYNEELLREEEAKLEAEDEYRREEADRLWEENERYNEELLREEEAKLEAEEEYRRDEADRLWEENERYNEELLREEEAKLEAEEEYRRDEADRLWEENERYNEELLREEEAKLEAEEEYRREEADRLWEENERYNEELLREEEAKLEAEEEYRREEKEREFEEDQIYIEEEIKLYAENCECDRQNADGKDQMPKEINTISEDENNDTNIELELFAEHKTQVIDEVRAYTYMFICVIALHILQ